ncbi:MAG: NAD(P)/FAD-dependent oxidoreductase [Cyclobacteriaceae bacterium]|nr:NAD(P)/FAD-dependent oxidoreductase [Cyclobacteriaceae bacterium]
MLEKKIVIAGGGLAGLICSIHLTRSGVPCRLIEKNRYPFHRVCGEYISNEVIPYLKSLDVFPSELNPTSIQRFQLTSVNGKSASLALDLGGFGVSRYRLDNFLFQKAKSFGVEFDLDTEVEKISYDHDLFSVQTKSKSLNADIVIGSFGKRSKLDVQLSRSFIQKRSPYVGVKYHIRLNNFPDDMIALHNFKDGYCGISRVEDGVTNLCYLTHRNNVKKHGSLPSMEKEILFQNPFLKRIFEEAVFLFDKPETINEISFETKSPVEDHIMMAGDAAGMITPLCGNGMAMAIHSAKILSEHIIQFCKDEKYTRQQMESDYTLAWRTHFEKRLWAGRNIQKLFGDVWASNVAVNLARHIPSAATYLMKKTHGIPF